MAYSEIPRTWVFSDSSASASAVLRFQPTGMYVPAMEATTTKLKLQMSLDGYDVADASATWVDVVDGDGTEITVPATTSAQFVQMTIANVLNVSAIRTRLVALDSSDAAVAQVAQEIVPYSMVL